MSQQGQEEFSRRLRALRRASGLTQREVAGDVLSVSYVSLLEAGRRSPTPETVRHLASALGCSPEALPGQEDTAGTRPPALNLRLGQLALESEQVEQARAHFEAVLHTSDVDPLLRTEAAIGLARSLEGQGRLREAADSYERLVQQAIQSPRYLSSLHVVIRWCRCLYELGSCTGW